MKKDFELSEEFANMNEEDRKNALNSAQEEVHHNYTYYRELSEVEILEKMKKVNQIWSEINKLEEKKKALTAKIKPLRLNNNKLNGEVSQKQIAFCETIWQVNNFDKKRIEFINLNGEIIRSDRMRGGVQMQLHDKVVNE